MQVSLSLFVAECANSDLVTEELHSNCWIWNWYSVSLYDFRFPFSTRLHWFCDVIIRTRMWKIVPFIQIFFLLYKQSLNHVSWILYKEYGLLGCNSMQFRQADILEERVTCIIRVKERANQKIAGSSACRLPLLVSC
jgi:hypothetical protein